MATAADGTILIDSHIITDGLDADISAIESRLRQIASKTRRKGGDLAKGASGNAEYDELARQLAAAEREADRLQKKFDSLVDKEEKFISLGGDTDSKTFRGYEYDIGQVSQAMNENADTISNLKGRMADLDNAAAQATQTEREEASTADQLRGAVAGVTTETSNAAAEIKSLGTGVKSASNGFKGMPRMVLKYGLGIRSVYILFRKLRSAIVEGFKNLAQVDNQTNQSISTLKSSLSQLKNSFAAAFAPVLNAVAPILNKLIQMLVTAANYIGMFFAALSGASTYRPAIYAYEDYASSLSDTAESAKEAAKNLSGLDEMNLWQSNSGGAGASGGAGPSDMFGDEEAIPNNIANIASKVKSLFTSVYDAVAPVLKKLWNMLVFEADDVLFRWDNLSSEDILEKIVAGFGLLFGAIAGFSITHSMKGLIIGAVVGLALSLLLTGVLFNDDGKISKAEILNLIVAALIAAAGAYIGFRLGGAKGAAIGAAIGVSLFVLLNTIEFSADPIKNAKIESNLKYALLMAAGGLFGATVGGGLGAAIGVAVTAIISIVGYSIDMKEAVKNKVIDDLYTSVGTTAAEIESAIQDAGEITATFRANLNLITGDISPEDLSSLQMAKDMIEKIYALDAVDNKSESQLSRMVASIEVLNSMQLDGIQVEYDELTGKVLTAKSSVDEMISSLEKQMRLEAIKEAWVSSMKAYYEAEANYHNILSSDTYKNATEAFELANTQYRNARAAYYDAKDAYAVGMIDAADLANAKNAFDAAGAALAEAKINVNEATAAVSDAYSAMEDASAMAEYFGDEYANMASDIATASTDTAATLESGIKSNSEAYRAALSGDYAEAKRILDQHTADHCANISKNHQYTQEELENLKGDYEAASLYAKWYKENFEKGMEGFTEKGLTEAQSAADQLESIWSSAKTTAKTNGQYIGDGLASGIQSKKDAVVKAAQDITRAALNEMKAIPQIASPSKVTQGYGKFIAEGLALGIKKEGGAAESAAARLSSNVLTQMVASFYGSKLPNSSIASGSVIPMRAALISNGSNVAELRGLLRDVLAEFFGSKTSRPTSVTAKVNSRTLFDVMIEEGQQRMRANGRNPFTDIAML